VTSYSERSLDRLTEKREEGKKLFLKILYTRMRCEAIELVTAQSGGGGSSNFAIFTDRIRIVNEDAPICTEAEELAQQGFLDTSTRVTGICPSVKIYRYILYTDDIFMYKDLSSDSSTILALRVLYHVSKKNH